MKKFQYIIAIVFLHLLCGLQSVNCQDTTFIATSPKKKYNLLPQKAAMLSAVFPGMGQIYNRKYWKLPLVYAGFGGLGYSVTRNATLYNKYIKAFQDFTDEIPETNSYLDVIKGADPSRYDPVLHPDTYSEADKVWVKDQMLLYIDYYRKYRDLSFIGIAAWYMLSVLDANVDASLFDYDVDSNLNLTVTPIPITVGNYLVTGVNFSLKINF